MQSRTSLRMMTGAGPARLSAFSAGARLSASRPAVAAVPLRRLATTATLRGPQNLSGMLLGHKAGMTQIYAANGDAVTVTVIAIGNGNIVTQVKTPETDGYSAVQVGFGLLRENKLTQPELGHLKKAEAPAMRHLVEFRVKDASAFKAGQQLNADEVFKTGDKVDVSGVSIGKGFQGTIKRHNFHRGFMTHGSKSHRGPGSISSGTTPGRVYPGKRMAGHMGNERVTVRGLEVVRVDAENKCIIVKGAVPGKAGNFLRVTPTKIIGAVKAKAPPPKPQTSKAAGSAKK